MAIVVDASAVVAGLVEPGATGEAARRVLREPQSIHAPDLIDLESVSALRRLHLQGAFDVRSLAALARRVSLLAARRWSARLFIPRVVELTSNLTPYDASYVALAEHLDCPLVTTDERLARAPGPRCEIRLVA